MADLTVLAGNLHNETAAVNYLRRRSRRDSVARFDVGFVSEAHKRRRALRSLPGHSYLTGPTKGPSQEVGILLGRELPLMGSSSQFVSSEIGGKLARVGKERWGVTALTEVDGWCTTALVTVHPVAGEQLRTGHLDDGHALVRRYTDAMEWLDATITLHRTLGHEVIIGGDLQVIPTNQQPWSVYPLLAAHGLEVFRDGIDLIAWTDGYTLAGNPAHRVDHAFPSDGHPAVRVELNINRTKRRKNA